MNKKRFCFSLLLVILIFSKAFSQEQTSDNSPKGKWAKSFGNSEYFLEIDNSVIKYINKKTEKYIRFSYRIEDSKIIFTGYGDTDPLPFNEINEDLYYHLTKVSGVIEFKRKNDNMSLFIQNHKNKPDEIKLITIEKKEENIKNAKTAGKALGTLAAAVLAYEAADYVIDRTTMQSIADDCLKASQNY